MNRGYAIALVPALMILPMVAGQRDETSAKWNSQRAAEYLDARCQTWFHYRPADRSVGSAQTSCLCCHTIVPYALARPALRTRSAAGDATDFEKKLLEQIQTRIDAWDRLDTPSYALLYDFNDQKKKESWGTEAVLNALLLAFHDRYQQNSAPNALTRKAFANLWKHQITTGELRGSWDWLDFKMEPWESPHARYYGACLAAIAIGSAPGYHSPGTNAGVDAGMRLLRTYLQKNFGSQNLNNRMWVLWASAVLDGILTPEQQKSVRTELLGKQRDDGGWSLSSLGTYVRSDGALQESESDGYATGLITHILQIAGAKPDDPKIGLGLSWLQSHQQPTGEWLASSVNKKRNPTTHVGKFMADAATAYAVLALSHQR